MASKTIKYLIVALALVAVVALSSNAQDYDDEGGNQGNDGYGGFSGSGGGDDDYAAPRDRGVVGAEGSDISPGYHNQGEDAGNDNYDNEDTAASQHRPTIARPNLIKLIKQSRK